ncbi:MAG: RIP metalloprotease RseP [Lentisphaerae bacterium GWF2_45_14]|nr:MAG: RIP metalloprotease RseP [Lentisphaerae bacterium GWF2_45_14]
MFFTILNYIGITLFALFFFSLCIFIHELGHFLAAKWRGLHINAFSIGFKKMWGFKYKGVEYRIGYLPFGGYVDIPQLEPTEEIKDQDGNPLPPIKPMDRMVTAFAGPLFNILLGFFLGTFIWIFGVPQDTPKMRSFEVASVEKESPEDKAGLRVGDLITSFNGKSFYTTWNGLVTKILLHTGEVTLGVKRADKNLSVAYLPVANPEKMPEEKLAYPFFEPRIPVVLYPGKNSPAEKAGIKEGDRVLAINGSPIDGVDQFRIIIMNCEGKPLDITVERNGKPVVIKNVVPGDSGEGTFRIGIQFQPESLALEDVFKGTPADRAGLKKGDLLVAVDSKKLGSIREAISLIDGSKGKELKMEVLRNGKTEILNVTPAFQRFYTLGAMLVYRNFPSPWNQFVTVIEMSCRTINGIFSKKSTISVKNLSGPIWIVRSLSVTVYRGSYLHGLYFIVMITFSLGLINLLPLPVLDGGHISMALVEAVIRRPLPHELVRPVTIFFVVLLIGLMALITAFDMKRVYHEVKGKLQPVQITADPKAGNAAKNESTQKKP